MEFESELLEEARLLGLLKLGKIVGDGSYTLSTVFRRILRAHMRL